MPQLRHEVPAGVIDGVNTTFITSVPYKRDTLMVWLNGQLKRADYDDGFIQTDPTTGVFDMKEPPRGLVPNPEVVQVAYIDTSPALPETEVTPMRGRLRAVSGMRGTVRSTAVLRGRLRIERVVGRVDSVSTIKGVLSRKSRLRGVLRVCDICG